MKIIEKILEWVIFLGLYSITTFCITYNWNVIIKDNYFVLASAFLNYFVCAAFFSYVSSKFKDWFNSHLK
jgi:hypothetical protein